MAHKIGQTIFFLLFFLGCNSNIPYYDLDNSFIIIEGAENIENSHHQGVYTLFYHLVENYPASKSISHIDKKLASLGWISLDYNDLNLNTPTSKISGWFSIVDPIKGSGYEAYLWDALWKNANGDYLKYTFKYTGPQNSIKEQSDLTIFAVFVPAKVAKEGKKKMERFVKTYK